MSKTVIYFLAFLFSYVTCSPSITTAPETFTKSVGSSVMLICQVQDHTTEVVTWEHVGGKVISQGNKLKTDDTDHFSVEIPQGENNIFTYVLHIMKLRTTDQGGYMCAVTGTNASVTHQLIINEAPPVPTPPPVHTYNFTDCCRKKSVSASCMPVCDPFTNLPENFDPLTSCVFDLQKLLECGSDGKNHAPCCKRRGLPDKCLDFCVGQMPVLDDTHLECLNKSLDIIMCYEEGLDIIPGPPTGVSATAMTSPIGFAVTWSPPTDNADKVEGYYIHYKLSSETTYQTSVHIGKDKTNFQVTGLKPNQIYNIYMTAFSVHGSSQSSEMLTLPTIGGTPPVDQNVDIQECCKKTGNMPANCQQNLCKSDVLVNGLDPNVLVQCYGSLEDALKCVSGHRNHTDCCMRRGLPDVCLPLCSGVVPPLEDSIAVCATKLPVINACIQEGRTTLPGPPQDLKVNPVHQTTATLHWNPPKTGTVTHYLIAYLEHSREGSPPNMVSTNKTSFTLTGLTPNTEYDVTMVSVNDAGQSLSSDTIGFLTYPVPSSTVSPITPSPGPALPYDLKACCKAANVTGDCLRLCDYDFIINATTDLFLLALQCQDAFERVIRCGSDGRDHTPCCVERRVNPNCYKVCQGNFDDIEITCALQAPSIAQCFKEGLEVFPRPPSDVTIDDKTFHTITLSWKAPTVGPKAEYYYVLCEGCDQKMRKALTTKTTYILQNLQPGYRYTISVVSVNMNGSSIPSPAVIGNLETDEHDYECSNNFTQNSNMVVDQNSVYKLVTKTVTTVEDCRAECINATHGDICTGFIFNTVSSQCTLAIGRYGKMLSRIGSDFYARSCNFDILDIPPMNGSSHVSWNNQKECCNHHNVSSECLPFCENGNVLADPDKCQDDFPVTISCAADNKNHTSCCQQSGVPDSCLPYCWGAVMDLDHIVTHLCLSYARIYITCFTRGKRTIPSIPPRFRVVNVGTTFIETAWEKPVQNCDMTTCLYTIQYTTANGISTLYNLSDTSKNLTNLKPQTQYYLTVSAVNMYGSSLSSLMIQAMTLPVVTFAVNFYKQPDAVIDSGNSVTLLCEVFGAPNAQVEIMFKGKRLTRERKYTITAVSKDDDGEYTCEVKENPTVTTPRVESLMLWVRYKPKITHVIGDMVAKDEGKTAYLKCIFEGVPLTVAWTKDNKQITYYTSTVIEQNDKDRTSIGTLTIYNVRQYMYGMYDCKGTNAFGFALGHMDLKSDYVPPTVVPPTVSPRPEGQNFSTCCINNGISGVCMDLCTYSVDFSIIIDDKYGDCIQHLPVYVTCGTDKKDHSKCCNDKGVDKDCLSYCKGETPDITDTEALLKCLPDATDIVKCIEEGQGTIPNPPVNVTVGQIEDKISVSWKAPITGSVPITRYDVTYHTSKDSKDLSISVAKDRLNIDIPKVLPADVGVTYYVSVTSGNTKGQSLPAKANPITITDMPPAAPKGLVATVDGSILHLKWTSPSYTGNIAVYVVKYKISAENSIPKELEVKGATANMATLNGLNPNTMYEIFVVGKSAGMHEGRKSNTITIKTGTTISVTDKNKGSGGGNRGGVIAVVVIIVLVLVGVAIAGIVYYKRRNRHRFSEAVTFENPQYGSHDSQIKISGLPSDPSEDNPFGYSPLHEDREEHYSSPMLNVDQVEFKPRK